MKNRTAVVMPALAFLFAFLHCQQNTHIEGARLYEKHCANCHMDDGIGLSALIPPIAGSDYLLNHRAELPCILRHGLKDTIIVNGTLYAEEMPGVPSLSAIHITNILNYVNDCWQEDSPPYRLDEVMRLLEECE